MPQDDREIVSAIISSKRELANSVDVKELDDLPKALRVIKALCLGAEKFDTSGNASKLSLASTMLFLKKTPSLWRPKYEKFDDFAKDKIYSKGFQKAQAHKYMAVAHKFGNQRLDRIAVILFESMYLISRHTDQTKPGCDKFLEAAEKFDYRSLVEWVAKKTGNTKESLRVGSFKVVGTVEEIQQLQSAIKNQEVLDAITDGDAEAAAKLSSAQIILAFLGEFASSHGLSV